MTSQLGVSSLSKGCHPEPQQSSPTVCMCHIQQHLLPFFLPFLMHKHKRSPKLLPVDPTHVIISTYKYEVRIPNGTISIVQK